MTDDRSDTPGTWDERATVLTMLGYVRETVHVKCAGLSDDLAAQAPLATSPLSTIGGFVNHLRWVEHSWFETRFLGEPDRGPWTDEEPDREMTLGAEGPLVNVLADYRGQCARTDEIVATHDLDDVAARPLRGGPYPTLRWIVLHMIEETARHNGHLDVLRELADGTTDS